MQDTDILTQQVSTIMKKRQVKLQLSPVYQEKNFSYVQKYGRRILAEKILLLRLQYHVKSLRQTILICFLFIGPRKTATMQTGATRCSILGQQWKSYIEMEEFVLQDYRTSFLIIYNPFWTMAEFAPWWISLNFMLDTCRNTRFLILKKKVYLHRRGALLAEQEL